MRGPQDRIEFRNRIPKNLLFKMNHIVIDKGHTFNLFNPTHKKYMINLAYGWKIKGSSHYHFLYTNSIKEIITTLRHVEPCECGECRDGLANKLK